MAHTPELHELVLISIKHLDLITSEQTKGNDHSYYDLDLEHQFLVWKNTSPPLLTRPVRWLDKPKRGKIVVRAADGTIFRLDREACLPIYTRLLTQDDEVRLINLAYQQLKQRRAKP